MGIAKSNRLRKIQRCNHYLYIFLFILTSQFSFEKHGAFDRMMCIANDICTKYNLLMHVYVTCGKSTFTCAIRKKEKKEKRNQNRTDLELGKEQRCNDYIC